MEYRIGLDIGIGSVGWAVVSAAQDGRPARIENFGTRIFESGENAKDRVSNCQECRTHRGTRRVERRRSHRKERLKNHFQKIGLTNSTFNDDYAACKDVDVYALKIDGIRRKLSPAELYKCLVHTCNHRGYRDFYEVDLEDKEASKNAAAANSMEKAFRESGKQIISEYLLETYQENGFVRYRNRTDGMADYQLVRRDVLRDETEKILQFQQQFYPCLTPQNIEKTVTVIFDQRDFEDGPGDPNDNTRRYHGFLDSMGKCPFYKDQNRGFRSTVMADVFAVTNTLSQYRFVNRATGETVLEPTIARELVDYTLQNANLTMKDVSRILKSHGFELCKSDRSDDNALGKSIKFLKLAKSCLGEQWQAYISEEQFCPETPSRLHQIGELISKYQTPKRRKEEMKKAGLDKSVIANFAEKRISGTSSVSYQYMCDSIHAFLNGDIYGSFQAQTIKQHEQEQPEERCAKLKPSHIDDPEIRSNRVVFKAVNETRKIINAIIDIYGSPTEIVVEVASELGQSFQMRSMEDRRQKQNAETNGQMKQKIAELLGIAVEEVRSDMVDRYKLYQEQGGICVYSGKPLGELKVVLRNADKMYEVDHIVPYSLILDNTLNNKALVFASENQSKRQRTPLEYMNPELAPAFLARVNQMYSRKDNSISKKKLDYYRLESVHTEAAQEQMRSWKSRNINDTRYITKYIAGILEKHLIFAGEKAQHVQTVKGAVTQKFRREWLRNVDGGWGDETKNRENYLNHAVDALIAANLTRPYIEVGSDAMKLRQLFFAAGKKKTNEYRDYYDSCVEKMAKYYGFSEKYTSDLLSDPHRIPAFLPKLVEEVAVRFNSETSEELALGAQRLYGRDARFLVPPQIPITSHKPERKFKGAIADDNPIRLVEIDGEKYKVSRKSIASLTKKELNKLYSEDISLKEQLQEIFAGKKDGYTVGNYLKEQGLQHFISKGGIVIRKVSVLGGKESNYYRKDMENGNYTYLGGLKYYTVEVYKDIKGNTKIRGLRYVDIVKKQGKLYQKRDVLPDDYGEHVMYLFPNDYIQVFKDGKIKYEGFYKGVTNIHQSNISIQARNIAGSRNYIAGSISKKDSFRKIEISILGQIGGKKKCSEPLPFIGEKKLQ